MAYFGVVYRITNLENDKCYIGRTKNTLRDRWYYHCQSKSGCLRLRNAIQKYGKESFSIEAIASSWDIENLKELEVLLIKQENTLSPNGYNLINTGVGGPDEMSDETREKIRETLHKYYEEHEVWNKGVPCRDETKQKLSEANMGREAWNKDLPWSDEMKQKLSEAHIGQVAWNKGLEMSDEYKRISSEAHKACFDPEHHRVMTEAARQANTGTPRSEETKRKIGDAHRGMVKPHPPHSEETKKHISEALQSSEKFKAYKASRVGKTRADNTSGHYGIIWDKARNKWQVRVNKKSYGRFTNIEDAITHRDTIMNT